MIKNLAILNIKGVSGKTYSFTGDPVVITGDNGSGKTTLLEAIRFLFGGISPDGDLIAKGETTASIEATVVDNEGKERVLKKTLSKGASVSTKHFVDGTPVKKVDFEKVLRDDFGIIPEFALVAAQETGPGLTPGQLQKQLSEVSPAKHSVNELLAMIPGLTADAAAAAQNFCADRGIDPEDKTKEVVEVVEEIYKFFFSVKALKKKEIESLQPQLLTLPRPIMAKKDIEEELVRLASAEASEKEAAKVAAAWQAAKERRDRSEAEIRELLNAASACSVKSEPDPTVAAGAATKADALRSTISEKNSQIAVSKRSIESTEKAIEKLRTDLCPLGSGLVCKTDKSSIMRELEEGLAKAKDLLSSLEKEKKNLEEDLNQLDEFIRECSRRSEEYRKYSSLVSKAETMKRMLVPLPEKPREPGAFAYAARRDFLRKELSSIDAYSANEERKMRQKTLKEELAAASLLAEAFAPKGVVLSTVQTKFLKVFNDAFEERAKAYGKAVTARFVPENGIVYKISFGGGEFCRFEELSKGEQIIASFLMQDLFNSIFGVKILLIDDLNQLDGAEFDRFVDFVTSAKADYEFVAMAATSHDDILESVKNKAFIQHIAV